MSILKGRWGHKDRSEESFNVKKVRSHLKRGGCFTENGAKVGRGRGQTRDFSASLRRVARGGQLG